MKSLGINHLFLLTFNLENSYKIFEKKSVNKLKELFILIDLGKILRKNILGKNMFYLKLRISKIVDLELIFLLEEIKD